jgi:hypothetical protein
MQPWGFHGETHGAAAARRVDRPDPGSKCALPTGDPTPVPQSPVYSESTCFSTDSSASAVYGFGRKCLTGESAPS